MHIAQLLAHNNSIPTDVTNSVETFIHSNTVLSPQSAINGIDFVDGRLSQLVGGRSSRC